MNVARRAAIVATACVLMGYGAYVVWVTLGSNSWAGFLFGGTTVAAGTLLLARKRWARFLVYLVVLAFVVAWVLATTLGERHETWEQLSALEKLLSYAPGLGMVAVALACAVVAGTCMSQDAGRPNNSFERTREG